MQAGEKISNYELICLLGVGGMGEVWKAVDCGITRREVAIKVVRSGAGPGLLEALASEARTLAKAPIHKNTVVLFGALEVAGELALVMEYIPGVALTELLKKYRNGLPWGLALEVFQGLFDGVGHAHQNQVIHRDLKPDNVRIAHYREGRPVHADDVKILDFGLARIEKELGTRFTRSAGGTLTYMSPEQIREEPQGPFTDVYALGILLYEGLVGHPPFGGQGRSSFSALVQAHCELPPPPPRLLRLGLEGPLEEALLRALAKDPAQRFQSAEAMGRAVLPLLRANAADPALAARPRDQETLDLDDVPELRPEPTRGWAEPATQAGPTLGRNGTMSQAGPTRGWNETATQAGPTLGRNETMSQAGPTLGRNETATQAGPTSASTGTATQAGPTSASTGTATLAGPTHPALAAPRPRSPLHRLILLGVVVLMAAGGGYGLWHRVQAGRTRERLLAQVPETSPIAGGILDTVNHRGEAIGSFRLARTPVTVAQFRAFVAATGHQAGSDWDRPGREAHPVTAVNYQDALAYVAWLAGLTGRTWYLPSDAEYEFAASDRGRPIPYPWGQEPPSRENPRANLGRSATAEDACPTLPVASYPANPLGLFDMLGNAWTWTSTQAGDGQRRLRGGGWNSLAATTITNYSKMSERARDLHVGFRVAER